MEENRCFQENSQKPLYGICLFGICLLTHFYFSLVGWNNCLLDSHGFRQTHTAITSYYFAKDGFRIAYETPVLGVPWSIPFEFPIFQVIVALIHKYLHYPLDQTGRAVSLFFFYFLLIPFFVVVDRISKCKLCAYLSVSLALMFPIYLFWSRAFLIESTALFFTLTYIMCIVLGLETLRYRWILLAAIAGLLAGLQKITTFAIGLGAGGLISLVAFYRFANDRLNFSWRHVNYFLLIFIFCVFLPIFFTGWWTLWAEHVRCQNPIASQMQSYLNTWNFGTMSQRLDLLFSDGMFTRLLHCFLGPINPIWGLLTMVGVGITMLVLTHKQRINIGVMLVIVPFGEWEKNPRL